MGFFSWMTADTDKSISNSSSVRGPFKVTVLCPDGTKITEEDYEGYGEFGGKDIYQLLAQWNCPERCNGELEHDRGIGIEIGCGDERQEKLKFPIKIVEDGTLNYDDVPFSPNCPDQGFFYAGDKEGEQYCDSCGCSFPEEDIHNGLCEECQESYDDDYDDEEF